MLRKEYVRYYAPAVFFLLMLLDGQFTRVVGIWSNGGYLANVHLLLLAVLCGCITLPKRFMILTTIILGIIYDSYYIGVIGIFAVALPVTVLCMYGLAKTINTNVFTLFFGYIIFITSFEAISLAIQFIFKLAVIDGSVFITQYLAPTLLLNMGLFVLLIVPFKKLFVIK
ncbi:rod shape-determining protein MreD [Enterococcus sp. JM4C]|uniref:rod shape-determining protein MreD n=1 Tax=Candidatus Enterococcus huntleyi TaxID=1857217 RepID=UPI0013796668|nr:rod shape-determining protein MreD [Enterococcus sp. JM4C]KAF1295249.1 rod shape-determining protein MreD [Enterococcus sp. JM4C]